jgi:cystathionine gamma-synthase
MGKHHVQKSVLVGTNTYFECKQQLKALCGEGYHEVDETDERAIKKALETYKPHALFVDTIANAPSMSVAIDPKRIAQLLERHVPHETYLVIDNTATSIFCQPFSFSLLPTPNVRTIAYESLNKFHQFGADGVFGGIILSRGGDTVDLFDWRVHMGTNISDSAVLTLPTPNRRLLTKRMRRLERNARFLASSLAESIPSHPAALVARIIYPGLPNHPGHVRARTYFGAYFTLGVREGHQSVKTYKRITNRIMAQAKHDTIPLIAGTSFGLPTTRIYLTALRAEETTPFIRIAAGSENILVVRALAESLAKSVISLT